MNMTSTLNMALENHRSDDNAVLDTILLNIDEFENVYTNITNITETILTLVYDTEELDNIIEYEDVDISDNSTKYVTKDSLKQEYGQKINEIYLNKFMNKDLPLIDRLNCYINKIYLMEKKFDENILATLNDILKDMNIDLINDNKKLISLLKEDKVLFDSCKAVLLKLLFDDNEFGFKLNIDELLINTAEYKENLINMVQAELTNKNMNNIISLLNKLKTIDLAKFNELRQQFISEFKKAPIEAKNSDDTNDRIDELYESYLINNYNNKLRDLV